MPGIAPTHSINGTRYINGGVRSGENADLASGYANVVVLSPFGGWSQIPLPEGQFESLRRPPGRGPAGPGRGPVQAGQPRRGDHTGRRFPSRNGHEPDGSGDASALRSSRLQPRQSPCRPAHRILALTPTKPVDSVCVTTPAHASEADGRGVVVDVRADDRIRAASIPPTHAPERELATYLDQGPKRKYRMPGFICSWDGILAG
jgi:hypothetical protein